MGPFSLERRRRNDRSVSSLCITEGGTWRRWFFSEVPSKRTRDNNLKLKWEMEHGCSHLGAFFFTVLEQGLREALGKGNVAEVKSLLER